MTIRKPEGAENYRTTPELAKWMGVSTKTVFRWSAAGKIQHTITMHDGTRLWSPVACDEAMKYRRSQLPSERARSRRIT